MSPVGDITIYESQMFRAYGAPTAAVRDFYSKSSVYFAIYHRQSIRCFLSPVVVDHIQQGITDARCDI